jgi:hypothetical protein
VCGVCHGAELCGAVFCPDFGDILLEGKGGARLSELCADIFSDDLRKLLGDPCRALCKQDFQICIDEVEMDGRIAQVSLVRQQFVLDEGEGERCVTPSVFEDAVDTVEKEQNAVNLRDRDFDFACAECFDGDDVRP